MLTWLYVGVYESETRGFEWNVFIRVSEKNRLDVLWKQQEEPCEERCQVEQKPM